MSIIQDTIDQLTNDGTIVQVVSVPEGDPGYGTDLSCTDDLTEQMVEVQGDSPLAVAQANYRRLRTQRGQLPDDLDYGLDIRAYLNRGMTVRAIQQIAGQIRGELLKDDRNLTITVKMTPHVSNSPTTGYDLRIDGTTAQGPFSLTYGLVDGDLLLKDIYGQS